MKLKTENPKVVLNKAFLKQRPLRSEIETFKANLKTLLGKVEAKESEENKKNHVRDFLLDTYYKGNYEVNTKDRKDLVIHLDKTNSSNVGVIVEAKSPDNKAEMLRTDKINTKAFQELVLYYFDERHTKNNSELKNLIVTNAHEWFIFDANAFDKQIYRNTQIKRLYETKISDKKDNPFFYEELHKIFDNSDEEIACTYFNLKDYETYLNNADLEDDKNLIELFKVLSPYHLLKVPFADDSNALNKQFYDELLHIIGLEEIKVKSKSIIRRKEESNRDQGSLLENAITILKTKDSLRKVKDVINYGETTEERYFNVALELCITWINRILFLKLLEAQLVNYQKGNREYKFLNIQTIPEFDELFTLFHQVLAKTTQDREENIREKYKRVPYLNSSLFEISELEDRTISIESLKDKATLNFINSTILKSLKTQNQKLNTLEYLFRFLDAYDFASEGFEDVQEDNRSLINASVLGKVFEKINGYKDGSIFTPGFITMYMCRQAIRLAVIQKFKDKYGWSISEFADLNNYLKDRRSTKEILEFNELINSLHLCDPAVGSGHFLVSSLNEIISIKSELGLLADAVGVRLSDYEITIENDELIITDEKGDIFEYQMHDGKPSAKAQKLQKTLFHEKLMLIENCLFGVDINPNSVKICRLRLWIELLKNAYYKESSGFAELETLPNIDINIKEGNSLVSRFSLDEDLSIVLGKVEYSINDYQNFVLGYKETRDREKKREFEKKIKQIKDDFTVELNHFSPERKQLAKLENELFEKQSKQFLFGEDEDKKVRRLKRIEELKFDIDYQKQKIKEIEENAIYKNAFEWRFEFPEVLDNEGSFLGFDVVIGNPPYGIVLSQSQKAMLNSKYEFGTTETAILFIVKALEILKVNGSHSYILPKAFTYASNYEKIRKKIQNDIDTVVDCGKVWQDVKLEVCIYKLVKGSHTDFYQSSKLINEEITELTKVDKNLIDDFGFFINGLAKDEIKLGLKIIQNCQTLNDIAINQRGAMLQKQIVKSGENVVIGGAEVQKYKIAGIKGYINNSNNLDEKAYIKTNSVLVQNIIAHIENPIDHIKITAYPTNNNDKTLIVDTINQITLKNEFNNFFVSALLNSKFSSWYAYRFVFGKAIRTMHFDNSTTSKIPIPKISEKDQQPFIALVDQILDLKKEGKDTKDLENQIDEMVYRLYDLTDEEIAIVEGKK